MKLHNKEYILIKEKFTKQFSLLFKILMKLIFIAPIILLTLTVILLLFRFIQLSESIEFYLIILIPVIVVLSFSTILLLVILCIRWLSQAKQITGTQDSIKIGDNTIYKSDITRVHKNFSHSKYSISYQGTFTIYWSNNNKIKKAVIYSDYYRQSNRLIDDLIQLNKHRFNNDLTLLSKMNEVNSRISYLDNNALYIHKRLINTRDISNYMKQINAWVMGKYVEIPITRNGFLRVNIDDAATGIQLSIYDGKKQALQLLFETVYLKKNKNLEQVLSHLCKLKDRSMTVTFDINTFETLL